MVDNSHGHDAACPQKKTLSFDTRGLCVIDEGQAKLRIAENGSFILLYEDESRGYDTIAAQRTDSGKFFLSIEKNGIVLHQGHVDEPVFIKELIDNSTLKITHLGSYPDQRLSRPVVLHLNDGGISITFPRNPEGSIQLIDVNMGGKNITAISITPNGTISQTPYQDIKVVDGAASEQSTLGDKLAR